MSRGLEPRPTDAGPPATALPSAESPTELAPRGGRTTVWLVGAFLLGYAALSYYSNAAPDAKGLGVALSIGPLLLIGLVLLFRWAGGFVTALVAAVAAALLYHYLPSLKKNFEWLDLVQQCGMYGLVAVSFAGSLLPGQVPLCTQLAVKMHGALTPIEVSYTRRATGAWMIFYLALVAAIIVLFLHAPLRIWSLFVNFATFGLILLMGLADHCLRRAVLPPRPSGGLLGILQRALFG